MNATTNVTLKVSRCFIWAQLLYDTVYMSHYVITLIADPHTIPSRQAIVGTLKPGSSNHPAKSEHNLLGEGHPALFAYSDLRLAVQYLKTKLYETSQP